MKSLPLDALTQKLIKLPGFSIDSGTPFDNDILIDVKNKYGYQKKSLCAFVEQINYYARQQDVMGPNVYQIKVELHGQTRKICSLDESYIIYESKSYQKSRMNHQKDILEEHIENINWTKMPKEKEIFLNNCFNKFDGIFVVIDQSEKAQYLLTQHGISFLLSNRRQKEREKEKND